MNQKDTMRKYAKILITSAAVLLVLGITAWAFPHEVRHGNHGPHEHNEPTVKPASENRPLSEAEKLQERHEIKQIVDDFYDSIADTDRIYDYQELIDYLNADETLSATERIRIAKDFFAPEMMLFDPISMNEDSLFSILSISMVAAQDAGYPEPTVVPLEAISVDGDTAMVDLSMLEVRTQETKPSGYIELHRHGNSWLITTLPGIE